MKNLKIYYGLNKVEKQNSIHPQTPILGNSFYFDGNYKMEIPRIELVNTSWTLSFDLKAVYTRTYLYVL